MPVTDALPANNARFAGNLAGPLSLPRAGIRPSTARNTAIPVVPHTDSVRGFVFGVAPGKLDEVK